MLFPKQNFPCAFCYLSQMKTLLIVISFIISGTTIAQIKRETISKMNLGTIECTYTRTTENHDTSTHISIIFQNQKYKSIRDLKVITILMGKNSYNSDYEYNMEKNTYFIEDYKYLKQFLNQLTSAFQEMGKKSNLEWKDSLLSSYSIVIYDFSILLYLEADRGYTTLKKNQVKMLIIWLSKFYNELEKQPILIIEKSKTKVEFK